MVPRLSHIAGTLPIAPYFCDLSAITKKIAPIMNTIPAPKKGSGGKDEGLFKAAPPTQNKASVIVT